MMQHMTPQETAIQLRALGCPYGPNDFRAKLWLEGYRAGFQASHENALASLKTLLGKSAA
jgi:hypothetical protein